ncbi:glycosyltransferase [Thermodesulfobacteriota bacterium]
MDMKEKRLSIVVAALDTYEEIKDLMNCLEKQTIREQLEIVIVCKTLDYLQCPESVLDGVEGIKIIEGGSTILLNEARAMGVRESTSPYVAILEDHCFPDPDWAYHTCARFEEGWSGVGSAIMLANPRTIAAQAAILMGYGQWHPPIESGEVDYLPGHNSAFIRKILMERGGRLESDLVVSSLMQAELRKQGHRFYLEAKAMMHHWDPSTWKGIKAVFIPIGRALAAMRSREWGFGKRLLYCFATPLIAVVRWYRSLVAYYRVTLP